MFPVCYLFFFFFHPVRFFAYSVPSTNWKIFLHEISSRDWLANKKLKSFSCINCARTCYMTAFTKLNHKRAIRLHALGARESKKPFNDVSQCSKWIIIIVNNSIVRSSMPTRYHRARYLHIFPFIINIYCTQWSLLCTTTVRNRHPHKNSRINGFSLHFVSCLCIKFSLQFSSLQSRLFVLFLFL